MFVFNFDEDENIISQKAYNLLDKNDFNSVKEESENNIHKRGLLEKLFGGVGPQQFPNTSP